MARINVGLSSAEVQERLKKYGLNEISYKKQLVWPRILLSQFRSPLIYILFFAGWLTLFLRQWTDSVVIFITVTLNTVLGFLQEYKAERSLRALQKYLLPQTKVIRDDKEKIIEAKYLVPGDRVILNTGSKVPADGFLLSQVELQVDEAILTGESRPVGKKIKEPVFMGTVIVAGRAEMRVIKTGLGTKMGQIAAKLEETMAETTPLRKQIASFSKTLAIIFSFICLLIFVEGLLKGRDFIEILTLTIAVAVAAIPEGLVISMTVILTLGMQRILKRKGLVRRLLAAETLGAVDVICADKTGTLTEGKMTVAGFDLHLGQKQEGELAKAAILCNNMINPLEITMSNWASKRLPAIDSFLKKYQRLDEIPFSSKRKFISVLVKTDANKAETIVSGAPEMIMELSSLSEKEKEDWQLRLKTHAQKGLRVVAFACQQGKLPVLKKAFLNLKREFGEFDDEIERNRTKGFKLLWLGLLLFEDPVRQEVKEALKKCLLAGIDVKVITGDYCETAASVLNKLELNSGVLKEEQVMAGWQLETISRTELLKRIDKIVLFCRTTPEQKIKIVEALQEKGHLVAMMGDGVNDALALKKADIGVVVGEASEVAKETADMVLLDSNFKTVEAAIEEGRGIFENIRKVILYLLSGSFTEVILIGGSLFLGLPSPVVAAQILWVNLVEDGLPGLALAFEPKDKGLMREPPRPKQASILSPEIKTIIFIISLTADLLLLGLFYLLLRANLNLSLIRTIIFSALATDSLLYIFSCRSLKRHLWQDNIFSNKFLVLSVFIGFLLLLAGIYLPTFNLLLKTQSLPLAYWLLIFGKAGLTVFGIEMVKWLFLREKSDKGKITVD